MRTWLPVSTQLSIALVLVFQKRMQRSAVPPPLASRPCWWGDQAIALTAAVCSVKRASGWLLLGCRASGQQTNQSTRC